jgi:hypothetical protein
VEYDVYIEQRWRDDDFIRAEAVEFEWGGGRWSIPRPETLGDLHYVWVEELETGGGWLQLVLVRELPFLRRLMRIWRRDEPDLLESDAVPTRVADAPNSPGADDGSPGRAGGGPPRAERHLRDEESSS